MNKHLLFLLLLCPSMAHGAVYKCPGADGKVTYSDKPCPGTGEEMHIPEQKGLSDDGSYDRYLESRTDTTPTDQDIAPSEPTRKRQSGKIVGEGGNRGKGWESDGSGGYEGTGGNRGKGWESDGSGGYVGTGGNRGEKWESDGKGGHVGTGGNRGAGWEADGKGGLIGTGSNRGCGWEPDGKGGMIGTGCNRGKKWAQK